MNKLVLGGYFLASAWFWAFEALRAFLSKYYAYSFTVYYAQKFGVVEWVGDVIAFVLMFGLSVIFIIYLIKSREDDTAIGGGCINGIV